MKPIYIVQSINVGHIEDEGQFCELYINVPYVTTDAAKAQAFAKAERGKWWCITAHVFTLDATVVKAAADDED